MGNNRDLFKKIRDIKGIFHAKMSTIKDKNCMDLTEKKILRRGGKNTEELYQKDLHNPDNHNRVITHLEPDILACEVNWALGSDLISTSIGSSKKQESSRKTSISALLTMPKPLTLWITTNWKIVLQMGIPDHLNCFFRNLYSDQEAIVRTGHGTTD